MNRRTKYGDNENQTAGCTPDRLHSYIAEKNHKKGERRNKEEIARKSEQSPERNGGGTAVMNVGEQDSAPTAEEEMENQQERNAINKLKEKLEVHLSKGLK
jgi:hypothetical protein